MVSLEKKMFFVPNRFCVPEENTCFVSFNIAVIPPDMTVKEMFLHVSVANGGSYARAKVWQIAGGWDEQIVAEGYRPPKGPSVGEFLSESSSEIRVPLKGYEQVWRFDSLQNHGLCLEIQGPGAFSESVPPYLIVSFP